MQIHFNPGNDVEGRESLVQRAEEMLEGLENLTTLRSLV